MSNMRLYYCTGCGHTLKRDAKVTRFLGGWLGWLTYNSYCETQGRTNRVWRTL